MFGLVTGPEMLCCKLCKSCSKGNFCRPKTCQPVRKHSTKHHGQTYYACKYLVQNYWVPRLDDLGGPKLPLGRKKI